MLCISLTGKGQGFLREYSANPLPFLVCNGLSWLLVVKSNNETQSLLEVRLLTFLVLAIFAFFFCYCL